MPAVARTLPDPVTCARTAGVPATGASGPEALLFARAGDEVAAGRFEAAEQLLDCADATLGTVAGPQSRYELVRQRGILDFRRERIADALAHFDCALSLSRARVGDDVAVARDLKNVGAALRRLGDFRGALRSLSASLDLQRAQGAVGGAVLNNIADVYRDLRTPAEAMRYYREALAAYRQAGGHREGAHVLESMAELALDTGDARQALRWQEEALQVYRDGDNRAYQLRVYGGLIRAELALGDLAQARRWSAAALAVALDHQLPLPASLRLQVARAERLSGHEAQAEAQVLAGLAEVADSDAERPALTEELAAIQESKGDTAAAVRSMREAHAQAMALAQAQNDRQLDWLRTRFETAERDRTIAALEAENRLRRAELRQRTLLLGLTLASGIAAALALWALWQRYRLRERLKGEAWRVRHEEVLAQYRRDADALVEERRRLQTLLDSREDAVCLLDADGVILSANRAAGELLGMSADVFGALVNCLSDADRSALSSSLERMEDTARQSLQVATVDGRPLALRLAPWDEGDGLIIAELHARQEGECAATAEEEASPVGDPQGQNDFRRFLVELMLSLVDAWERGTGTSRIELAEKSRIWRVNIDDGRLRARAMERYLAVSKLPRNPRWRDVLRSAYFVLGHCPMEPRIRDDLQRRVDAVLAHARRNALS